MIKHHEQAREGKVYLCLGFQRPSVHDGRPCQAAPDVAPGATSSEFACCQQPWSKDSEAGVGQDLKLSKPIARDILQKGTPAKPPQQHHKGSISHRGHHRKLACYLCNRSWETQLSSVITHAYLAFLVIPLNRLCFCSWYPVNTLIHQTVPGCVVLLL